MNVEGEAGDPTGDRAVTPVPESDPDTAPAHRGWAPLGGRRRWMEPFVLALLAEGSAHGYGLIGQLQELGVSGEDVDVGQVYKTLRDLEAVGEVASTWSSEPTGPQRRDYVLTEAGWTALDEWAAVMRERRRLIEDFETRYRRAKAAKP
jgi:PadR family transcriptional regulator, regulatory protein PadR